MSTTPNNKEQRTPFSSSLEVITFNFLRDYLGIFPKRGHCLFNPRTFVNLPNNFWYVITKTIKWKGGCTKNSQNWFDPHPNPGTLVDLTMTKVRKLTYFGMEIFGKIIFGGILLLSLYPINDGSFGRF